MPTVLLSASAAGMTRNRINLSRPTFTDAGYPSSLPLKVEPSSPSINNTDTFTVGWVHVPPLPLFGGGDPDIRWDRNTSRATALTL